MARTGSVDFDPGAFELLRERDRPSTPLLIGIGYSFQEVDALPTEDWDVPLDLIVTERETIRCGR